VVVFGAVEALGLLSLAVLVVAAAMIARAAFASREVARELGRIDAKLADFEEREEINRLRHRDFSAFLRRLNARRQRLGQEALAREYLEPHRYNLMYSVDAGDVDAAALEKLRKRVGKAVKAGQEPVDATQAAEQP
jgi:cytidylate kinase